MSRAVIESRQMFAGPVFAVDRDRIREGDGREVTRDVVRHPGGAGGIAIFDDGRIALLRQYRHPTGRDLLEIPAGRIDRAETPEECATREIEEEIGWRPGKLEKLAEFYSTPGFCEEKLFIYLATDLSESSQRLDDDEVVEVILVTLDDAQRLVMTGEIEDAKTIIAILTARDLLMSRHTQPLHNTGI